MAENIQRSKGRSSSYKFDRGGMPTEFGPYIGVVKNNVDPTRSGRLQVYIEQFGGSNENDKSLWRTVSYIPPFYGVTPLNAASSSAGTGSYKGNQQSYGMWFTPPDVDVRVICFFVAGDPNQGYYIGCVPEPGVNHMIPAIGATQKFKTQNAEQESLTTASNSKQLPVVEINVENKNINDNPKFWTETKPVHSYLFAILANQGLLSDYIRGPISSSSQRESPSAVFGMSTPGRAIYKGGLSEKDIKAKLNSGAIKVSDIQVEGRRGGHSFVMDDGDLQGRDNLIRIRTAKGHQITMSDEADCLYIIAANGQTWIELGSEGTVDIYSTNSVNVRSQGTINLHADKDININAGENFNVKAKNMQFETQETFKVNSAGDLTIYSKTKVGVLSDGSVVVNSSEGGWKASGELNLKASKINLNSGSAPETIQPPKPITEYSLDDTKFEGNKGWQVTSGTLKTIVQRAPTHEPYPYHNKGVPVEVSLSEGGGSTATPNAGVERALAGTASTPVTDQINAADVLSTPVATAPVGNLNQAQVTGLLAQAKTATGQAANAISPSKGIGQFGFKPEQLESSGFLKPGTVKSLSTKGAGTPTAADITAATAAGMSPQEYLKNKNIQAALASPTLWTGKGGVTGLGSLLSNEKLQVSTQQTLMSTTLKGMQSAGITTGIGNVNQLGALVQSATKFGVGAVASWTKGVSTPALKTSIDSLAKSAQFSTSFITNVGDQLGLGSSKAEAASNTFDRSAIDAAVVSSLNDSKIPAPEFKPADRTDTA